MVVTVGKVGVAVENIVHSSAHIALQVIHILFNSLLVPDI